MKVRIRGPKGQSTISLADAATVSELQYQISVTTAISDFDLKFGYPPKPLSLNDYEPTMMLSKLGVKLDGEQLIVSERASQPSKKSVPSQKSKLTATDTTPNDPPPNNTGKTTNTTSSSNFSFANISTAPPQPAPKPTQSLSLNRKPDSSLDAPELPLPTHASTLLLRIMPDDNSCLFRAFDTAFLGTGMDNMHELRSIIAQSIQAKPEVYTAVVLEQSPDDYCRWIQTEDAWGGAIELDILSKHFEVEICSIDVQTLRTDRFNEGRPERCILVYSGIHYDTIALSPSEEPHISSYAPPDFDSKIFSAGDSAVLEGAVELCRVLQGRHYYTDTASFSVRCNICGQVSKGEKGATEHAQATGHYDFGEDG